MYTIQKYLETNTVACVLLLLFCFPLTQVLGGQGVRVQCWALVFKAEEFPASPASNKNAGKGFRCAWGTCIICK